MKRTEKKKSGRQGGYQYKSRNAKGWKRKETTKDSGPNRRGRAKNLAQAGCGRIPNRSNGGKGAKQRAPKPEHVKKQSSATKRGESGGGELISQTLGNDWSPEKREPPFVREWVV